MENSWIDTIYTEKSDCMQFGNTLSRSLAYAYKEKLKLDQIERRNLLEP